MHLHEEGLGVRDSLFVCVIHDAAGRVIGIAPHMLTERPGVGPIRLRALQFIGADPNITEIRMMLCLRGLEARCYAALRDYFAARSDIWDWISWEGPNSRLGPASALGKALHRTEEKSAFVLMLGPSWDDLKAGLGRNIKQSLRKCYNSLRRDGLTMSLEIVDQPATIGPALGDFFRLHALRAGVSRPARHRNVFESRQSRAFLTEVCERLAERGIARVFRLRIDDRIVATRIGFHMAGTLYLYYSGWDPAFGRYSVMTTLVAEVIQDAIARGLRAVNLSTGRDVSKTRWGPDEVPYVSGVELSPRPSARALYCGYVAARRIGADKLARALTPGFLVRRSRTRFPRLSWTPARR
jgi:CelD/BcsL family acetyltransferase involved in cellulose biosynthesis